MSSQSSTLTGYEPNSRMSIPIFSGRLEDWPRWKRTFLLYLEELGLEDAINNEHAETKKKAKTFRILFLSCGEDASNLIHTRIPDSDGPAAWKLLTTFYERNTADQIAQLHQDLFTLAPPQDNADIHRYINKVIEIRNRLTALSKDETPTQSAIYGKIKKGLVGELLAYADVLEHTVTDLDERILAIQRKAQALASSDDHAQAQPTQAFQATGRISRGRGRGRGARGGRSNIERGDRDTRTSYTPTASTNQTTGPPRHIFRCPYHRSNQHSQEECRASKSKLQSPKPQAKAANTSGAIAWAAIAHLEPSQSYDPDLEDMPPLIDASESGTDTEPDTASTADSDTESTASSDTDPAADPDTDPGAANFSLALGHNINLTQKPSSPSRSQRTARDPEYDWKLEGTWIQVPSGKRSLQIWKRIKTPAASLAFGSRLTPLAWMSQTTPVMDLTDTQENISLTDLQDLLCASNAQPHASAATTQDRDGFHLDSACSHHMTLDREDFATYQPFTSSHNHVTLADGSETPIAGQGDVHLSWPDTDGTQRNVKIRALHVPAFRARLFSVSQSLRDGYGFSIGVQSLPNTVTTPDGHTHPITIQGLTLRIHANPTQPTAMSANHASPDSCTSG